MKTENNVALEVFLAIRKEVERKQEVCTTANKALTEAKKALTMHLINFEHELSPVYNSEGDVIKITGYNGDGNDYYLISGPCGANRTYIDDLKLECDFTPPYGREEF
uniref:Uncharacterized protein n=1 Tax=viral metagenome TaxID=1070528 RepID=A0A6M3JR18_9ZZZZ